MLLTQIYSPQVALPSLSCTGLLIASQPAGPLLYLLTCESSQVGLLDLSVLQVMFTVSQYRTHSDISLLRSLGTDMLNAFLDLLRHFGTNKLNASWPAQRLGYGLLGFFGADILTAFRPAGPLRH